MRRDSGRTVPTSTALAERWFCRGAAAMLVVLLWMGTSRGAQADGNTQCPWLKRAPTEEQLWEILAKHSVWVKSVLERPTDPDHSRPGERANLCGAELGRAKLRRLNLSWATFDRARLAYA